MESKSLNSKKGILLVALSTIIIAVAQLFLKTGATLIDGTIKSILVNYPLWIGIVLYALATFLLIYALKFGDLSALYPVIGLGYVWVCLLSFFVFKEIISILDIIGIFCIVSGVALLGVHKDG